MWLLVRMFVTPIWRSWATSMKICTQLLLPFERLQAKIYVCSICYDVTDHQGDKAQHLSRKWTKFSAVPSFNIKRKKKVQVPKPFMKTWLQLMGRMLHLTSRLKKSSQLNLEEEERAFKTIPPSWKTCNCHKPRHYCQSLWSHQGWPTTDHQAHSHYPEHLTTKCSSHFDQRTGNEESAGEMGPQTPDAQMCVRAIQHRLRQFALIWRRTHWLSGQISDYGWNMALPLHAWNTATVEATKTLWLARKAKVIQSAGKVKAFFLFFFSFFFFWNADGILLVDFLQN